MIRFPGGRVPSRPSEIAVLAVKTYEVFLEPPPSDAEIAAAIIAASRDFDRQAHRQEQAECIGLIGKMTAVPRQAR